ncbi:hypothetical protein DITRI_Ditri18aG0102000 [Diplodiscus trichospermus]
MGWLCCKTNEGRPEAPSPVRSDCGHDPDLQDFDATLQKRTDRVIQMLKAGSGVQSLSSDLLREVMEYLLKTKQNVAKIIAECQNDILKNQDLFSLVEEYFENSQKTLEFYAVLKSCLKRARSKQSIIQSAVKYYEEEKGLQVGNDEKKFVKTLEALGKFKAADEPFTEEFFRLFDSVRQQQESMLDKLLAQKGNIDKKLKSLKKWRRVSNVLFVATLVSVLIFSVVAAAIAVPPVVAALAGAMTFPIGSLQRLCSWLCERYENEMKGQEELITTIGARITIHRMENIRVLVDRLEIEIESLLHNADFALGEEDEVKHAIDNIKRNLDVFMETTKKLGEMADKYSHDITTESTWVFQSMTMKPSGTLSTGDSPWKLDL